MPTYDYHCTNCPHISEVRQKISDDSLKHCPDCSNETLRRGPGGGVGLIFKGTGFYITDYKDDKHPKKPESDQTKSE